MAQFPIEKFKEWKTPFFYYDMELLDKTLKSMTDQSSKYGYEVHYALKANVNEPILKKILSYGVGADCVSGNEVRKALEVGFTPNHIAFAGVGKSDEEINFGLENNIFCFNCESAPEIEVINELAGKMGKKARIALRINPNVNANTHKYITTGLEENKFGINPWELESVFELVTNCQSIELIGMHFHVGSQIRDLKVFRDLCSRVNHFNKWFLDRHTILPHINVGGGLGVDYHHPDDNPIVDFETYFAIFNQFLELRPSQKLHFELGRAIVAQCGSLISKVLYVKKGINTNFAILDAGMTELIRPALYQSYHKIENLTSNAEKHRYDVVGPICESSDCFGKALLLPEAERGDLFALRTTGAYGEVMSSKYNLRDEAKAYYSL